MVWEVYNQSPFFHWIGFNSWSEKLYSTVILNLLSSHTTYRINCCVTSICFRNPWDFTELHFICTSQSLSPHIHPHKNSFLVSFSPLHASFWTPGVFQMNRMPPKGLNGKTKNSPTFLKAWPLSLF